MAKHYTKLIIEINEDITSKVTAIKGDVNSRFLDVQLFNDSVPLDLTSHTVTMSAKSHPDSNFKVPINKFIDGQITEAINGRCQFKLETDILGQAGVIILQISVFSGEQEVLSTNPFNLYVIDGIRNDEQIEASNEFGALVVLFSEIQNALDDMNAIRENFGIPSQESIEEGILTFWGIIEQMRKDVASAVVYDLPEKVGNPDDTSEENTLFGKIQSVSEGLYSSLGNAESPSGEDTVFGFLKRGIVKSIQRGVAQNYSSGDRKINISAIDPSKSIVLIFADDCGSERGTNSSNGAVGVGAVLTSLSSNSFNWHLSADNNSSTEKSNISWQVIEFY